MLELISIHIRKTAGKSFDAILREVYGDENVLRPVLADKLWTLPILARMNPADIPPVLNGHFTFQMVEPLYRRTGARLMTWLRDPVERVISSYFYFLVQIRTVLKVPKGYTGNETLLDYAGREENRNVMARFLEGIDLKELFFCGITEYFDEELQELAQRMGWPDIKPVHINTNKDFMLQFPPVLPGDRDQIRKWNERDVELYEEACRIRGLRDQTGTRIHRTNVASPATSSWPEPPNRADADLDLNLGGRLIQWASALKRGIASIPALIKSSKAAKNCLPIPTFLIVGVTGCGTSALFRSLQEHPRVVGALLHGADGKGKKKSVGYFARNYVRGIEWYRSCFPSLTGCTGEVTSTYIVDPQVPPRVIRTNPRAKIIMLFREPVERAYRHYHRLLEEGKNAYPVSLEEKIQVDLQQLKGLDLHQLHRGVGRNILLQGFYARHYKAWLRYFPQDQILVFQSEQFFKQPQECLDRAFRFLELPGHTAKPAPPFIQEELPPMAPETRAMLQSLYAPYNAELYDCLGFGWDY